MNSTRGVEVVQKETERVGRVSRPVRFGTFFNNLWTGQESAEGIPPDCPTAFTLFV
jgi:hypothetical protein